MNQPKFLLHLNVDESEDNFSCKAPTLAVAHFASSFSFSTISGVLNDLPRERGIKRSRYSWLSLLYQVFLPLGLCFPTIPQITVFTPWLFPPHYLYLLLFIFFTMVFVTICNCYYFYGLLFVFFTIVFVIICICYYLYWLLFVLFTSRPTSSSPPASSLPPSSPQYGGLPRKPGRQKHLLQMPG